MAIRPTRRGLLAGLAGGLFAWLAPKEAKAAPVPAPIDIGGGVPFGKVFSCSYDGTWSSTYSTYLGGATTYTYDCAGGPPQPVVAAEATAIEAPSLPLAERPAPACPPAEVRDAASRRPYPFGAGA